MAQRKTDVLFMWWCSLRACAQLFTRGAARALYSNQHLQRWCFDVELIFLAQRLGIPIVETSVNWTEIPGALCFTYQIWQWLLKSLVYICVWFWRWPSFYFCSQHHMGWQPWLRLVCRSRSRQPGGCNRGNRRSGLGHSYAVGTILELQYKTKITSICSWCAGSKVSISSIVHMTWEMAAILIGYSWLGLWHINTSAGIAQ